MGDTQPESEIGPVAWVLPAVIAYLSRVGTHYMRGSFTATEVYTEPLYPQARIDADAAIIAGLRAEVEKWANSYNIAADQAMWNGQEAAILRTKLKAAEARVKELEAMKDG